MLGLSGVRSPDSFRGTFLPHHDSPKSPSSNKVDDVGKNETHDSGTPESSNTTPGSCAKGQAGENTNRSAAQSQSSSEADFLDEPLYPLREGYTRKLIKKKYAPPEMWDINFDEKAWMKEAYGENVIVVDMDVVPEGWILVDDMLPKSYHS